MKIDTIMQAVERLRRIEAGHPQWEVYDMTGYDREHWGVVCDSRMHDDQITISLFALSILPKGKRPVPIDRNGPHNTGWLAYAGEVDKAERIDGAWHVVHEVEDWGGSSVLMFDAYGDIYESADDARAELHWRRLEQVQAAAR